MSVRAGSVSCGSIFNQTPVHSLVRVGISAGATRERSFSHAEDLILNFGGSRTIATAAADMLYTQMHAWALDDEQSAT